MFHLDRNDLKWALSHRSLSEEMPIKSISYGVISFWPLVNCINLIKPTNETKTSMSSIQLKTNTIDTSNWMRR